MAITALQENQLEDRQVKCGFSSYPLLMFCNSYQVDFLTEQDGSLEIQKQELVSVSQI